jgi:predicted HTH domain antitoxin
MKPNTVEIKLDIDSSILLSMQEKKEEFTKALLFYSALGLYKTGKLSLGKAAVLCNTERLEFIKKIQEEGVAIFDYEKELIDDMISKANLELENV